MERDHMDTEGQSCLSDQLRPALLLHTRSNLIVNSITSTCSPQSKMIVGLVNTLKACKSIMFIMDRTKIGKPFRKVNLSTQSNWHARIAFIPLTVIICLFQVYSDDWFRRQWPHGKYLDHYFQIKNLDWKKIITYYSMSYKCDTSVIRDLKFLNPFISYSGMSI